MEVNETVLEVGLTGGIASGKTTVRAYFERRGIPTLDTDQVVHTLYRPGTDVTKEVVAHFGPTVIGADGSIDRKALGNIVFDDENERRALETIVHHHVFDSVKLFFSKIREQGEQNVAVVDAALMIETGSFKQYDRIVVVYCENSLQKMRLMDRDGIDMKSAEDRVNLQMPLDEKRKLADYVIDTSGNLSETFFRASHVIDQLQEEAING